MALFDDILADVHVWTKRPDLVALAKSAIRGQTLKYHRRHKFFKDIANIPALANPTPNSDIAIFDIAATFPRWRQFLSIRQTDSQRRFTEVSAEDLLDLDGYLKTDIYLVAGTALNIKANGGVDFLNVTYYQDPIATEAGYTSWIASEYPDLIAAGAAARVLAGDNEGEIFKAAKTEEAEQWATLVSSNLEAEGR